MNQRAIILAAGLLAAVPASAESQVHWDAPFHVGPGLTDGVAVHLVDPDPGSGIGAMVSWTSGSVPGGLGVRLGLAEGFGGDLAGFGGVDVSGTLISSSEEVPLDLIWAAGAGAGVGSHVLVSLPLGVYAGRSFVGDGIRFLPYAGPRISLDGSLGRDGNGGVGGDDELDLALSVDLGADIVLSDDLGVRFGASVGDKEALSIGLVLPGLR